MPPTSIFTRKRMGLDNKVWFSMLMVILLSLGLVGYKFKGSGEKIDCKAIAIYVNGRANTDSVFFRTGELLTFRSPINPGDKVSWDFGDGSKTIEGFSSVHSFKLAGIYNVTAVINGECFFDKKVKIKKAEPVIRDSLGNITENIIGEEQGLVGDNLVFSTPLPASTYEWYIENNNNYPKKSGDSISYKFRSAGNYILVLVLNQDRSKKFTKTIIVSDLRAPERDLITPRVLIPKETEPKDTLVRVAPIDTSKLKKEAPKKFKYLTDQQFVINMQALVCGTMEAAAFDAYLCLGQNTPVIANGKGGKTFASLAAEIHGKKIEIESVTAARENENCVVTLTVKYDKKGRLAKNPCKN